MTYVKELGLYINKVEDLRDKVSEDMYEAIESLVLNAGEYNDSQYRNLKEEFEAYESMLDDYRHSCFEINCVLEEYEKKLNKLYDYISDAKRMNRDKMLKVLQEVDLDHISNIITRAM